VTKSDAKAVAIAMIAELERRGVTFAKASEMPADAVLLTAQEAGDVLRQKADTIGRWCRDGKLPAVRVGRAWRINAAAVRAMSDPDKEIAAESARVLKAVR
jgi:excisionase family DNA binding protein